MNVRSTALAAAALGAALAVALATPTARAQSCAGVAYFEACLDAIGGRPAGSPTPRDPTRIVDDIFRTTDTPPRYAPELTFGQLMTARSVINSADCTGGESAASVSGRTDVDPRAYTAYHCNMVPPTSAATYANRLDWAWVQNYRVRSDGANATDQDNCGGDQALCGYESPWRSGFVFDLQGEANRVVVFPITDHTSDSCLEAFEYSVYLTNDPTSTSLVRAGESPDPARWNRAVLARAFLRGWTNNYLSTGTVADMVAHPLTAVSGVPLDLSASYNPTGEAVADSIATVWALPCGITFRYVAIVAGNYGNPDSRCMFASSEDEFDAVAGLNEDGSAICPDRDMDGFRDAACGGTDCNDTDPAVNPGAIEDCRDTRDRNCDGATPTCPTGTTCVNGLCAEQCTEGACAPQFACSHLSGADYCIPSACAGMTCPAGQVCGPMGCQAPCTNATCPLGQVCLGSVCIDACQGVRCATNQHCEAGRCVPNCACTGCAAPRVCNATTGRCEATGCDMLPCPAEQRDCRGATARCVTSFCDGVRCPLGQTCDATARACVADRCFGIGCPAGTVCRAGSCVREGTDGGAGTDGGGTGMDAGADGGGATMDGGRGDARLTRDGGPATGADLGCGCSTPGRGATGATGAALWTLLGAASVAARRRRRARR